MPGFCYNGGMMLVDVVVESQAIALNMTFSYFSVHPVQAG